MSAAGQTERDTSPRLSFSERVMRFAGREFCGNEGIPPEARTLYYATDGSGREVARGEDTYLFTGDNDGFELWFGTPHEWRMHLNAREVRTLTRYLVIDWYIKSRWLGLRRPIYYWALHRHVANFQRKAAL